MEHISLEKFSRCDICLEEKCGGKHNCHCATCSRLKECYRFLHATIRITTKCTQTCSHCCFSCSPESTKMMTIEKAKEISTFLQNNHIGSLNVMGGEFFCNPDWFDIIDSFLSVSVNVRLVSNGDWANNEKVKEQLVSLNEKYPNILHISISKDKWHNNINVESAEKFLKENKFRYNIGTDKEDDDNVIVPIGRGQMSYGLYELFACYCHKPEHMYSFLIDENGDIYKCGFGVWNYANIADYLDGGFRKKFKEFNKKFYGIWVSSCGSCIRIAKQKNHIVEN